MSRYLGLELLVVFLFEVFLSPAWAITSQVTVTWAPLVCPNVAGYQIVWGPTSNIHLNTLKVGNVSQANLDVESGATYSFAVGAIDQQGLSGELSAGVTVFISANRRRIGLPALASPEAIYLPSVKENSQFRSNLGVNNTTSATANVDLTLVDGKGIVRAVKSIQVPAGGMTQINRIIGDLSNGSAAALLEGSLMVESDRAINTWASEIENQTNDPSMLTGKRIGVSRLLIPSVANTAAWTSSLILENLGTQDAPIAISAYSSDGKLLANSLGTLVVPALGNLSFQNILAYLGVTNAYGPMTIISTEGQPLIAASRVSGNTGAGGFFEGVSTGFATFSVIVPHVVVESSIRTNLGINNCSSQWANITLRFIGKSGAELARMDTSVAPNGLKQINSAELAQIINGGSSASLECYVRIDSNQTIVGWASQIENSTNDPGFTLGRNVSGQHLLIPSAANTNSWSSSLVVVNTGEAPAYVDIIAHDNNGAIQGQMLGVSIPPGGFFSEGNILAFLGINDGFGPVEISNRSLQAPLIATSRVRSTAQTSGFFEGLIVE